MKKSINSHIFEYIIAEYNKAKYNKLFNICPCKCAEICRCTRECRVPEAEKEFLMDRRTLRMITVDCSSTTYTSIRSRRSVNEATTGSNSR